MCYELNGIKPYPLKEALHHRRQAAPNWEFETPAYTTYNSLGVM